jgi:hypothetical protein
MDPLGRNIIGFLLYLTHTPHPMDKYNFSERDMLQIHFPCPGNGGLGYAGAGVGGGVFYRWKNPCAGQAHCPRNKTELSQK